MRVAVFATDENIPNMWCLLALRDTNTFACNHRINRITTILEMKVQLSYGLA